MAACHFVVGGVLSSRTYVPEGVGGNLNVLIQVTGSKAHTVIAFSYLLIIFHALTLAPVAWVYAAEVWSLVTRASGMVSFFLVDSFRDSTDMLNCVVYRCCRQLAVQLRPRPSRAPWLRQHHMKTVHRIRRPLHRAASQVFFTYPETCGKTLEEVEEMFSKNGPKPWHTKPDHSMLDHPIEEAREKGLHVKDVGIKAETVENVEKTKAAEADV
ncbi:hypothetical protein GB937_000153 [Aspergillus fischeri]|nr:hypothetical protein GB937_000153 [Aspergillus fischeri]